MLSLSLGNTIMKRIKKELKKDHRTQPYWGQKNFPNPNFTSKYLPNNLKRIVHSTNHSIRTYLYYLNLQNTQYFFKIKITSSSPRLVIFVHSAPKFLSAKLSSRQIYLYEENQQGKWNKRREGEGTSRTEHYTNRREEGGAACIGEDQLTAIDLHYGGWLASNRAAYSYIRACTRSCDTKRILFLWRRITCPLDTRGRERDRDEYFIIRRNRPRRALGRKI